MTKSRVRFVRFRVVSPDGDGPVRKTPVGALNGFRRAHQRTTGRLVGATSERAMQQATFERPSGYLPDGSFWGLTA